MSDFDDLVSDESADFLSEPEPKVEVEQDWRDDPLWRLVSCAPELWSEAEAPNRPPAEAELASPPIWASLYDGGRIVATWSRPRAAGESSDRSATVVA